MQLYTCDENKVVNEYDFKKALDLLDYVESEDDRTSLKLRIWARAAARDQWDTVSKNPEQQVQGTLFFKLMDLVHLMGESFFAYFYFTSVFQLELEVVNVINYMFTSIFKWRFK